MVKGYRKSTLKQQEMRRIDSELKVEGRKLHLDVITRWNSTLYMLRSVSHRRVTMEHMQAVALHEPRRFGEVKSAGVASSSAAAAAAASEIEAKMIDGSEWKALEHMIDVSCALRSRSEFCVLKSFVLISV